MVESSRIGVVDAVWSVARDGGWHTQSSFAKRTSFRDYEIARALDFLVKYGFAMSILSAERRFKTIVDGPSPMKAAEIVHALPLRAAFPAIPVSLSDDITLKPH